MLRKVGLTCILVLTAATAVAAPFLSYELAIRSNTGHVKGWKLEEKERGYELNGIPIKPEKVIVNAHALNAFGKKGPSTRTQSCRSGAYVFRVTAGGKTSVEKGCLESARFKDLRAGFVKLGAL